MNEFGPIHELDLTRALVKEMRDYVESKGAEFILLNWGRNPNCGDCPFDDLDLNTVDTAGREPVGWETWYIPGDGHPDARAHAYVAELLYNEFENLSE
jgi:hypothetical protein